jgi:hypothetical protein
MIRGTPCRHQGAANVVAMSQSVLRPEGGRWCVFRAVRRRPWPFHGGTPGDAKAPEGWGANVTRRCVRPGRTHRPRACEIVNSNLPRIAAARCPDGARRPPQDKRGSRKPAIYACNAVFHGRPGGSVVGCRRVPRTSDGPCRQRAIRPSFGNGVARGRSGRPLVRLWAGRCPKCAASVGCEHRPVPEEAPPWGVIATVQRWRLGTHRMPCLSLARPRRAGF